MNSVVQSPERTLKWTHNIAWDSKVHSPTAMGYFMIISCNELCPFSSVTVELLNLLNKTDVLSKLSNNKMTTVFLLRYQNSLFSPDFSIGEQKISYVSLNWNAISGMRWNRFDWILGLWTLKKLGEGIFRHFFGLFCNVYLKNPLKLPNGKNSLFFTISNM